LICQPKNIYKTNDDCHAFFHDKLECSVSLPSSSNRAVIRIKTKDFYAYNNDTSEIQEMLLLKLKSLFEDISTVQL
jgi:hypothetical protein